MLKSIMKTIKVVVVFSTIVVNLHAYAGKEGGKMVEKKIEPNLNHALQLSMRIKHTLEADALIARGADPHARNDQGGTLLHNAAYYGDIENVEWLVREYGFNAGTRDLNNNTPAHMAAMLGHLDVIIWLADHGADLNVVNIDGRTVRDVLMFYYPDLVPALDQRLAELHPCVAMVGATIVEAGNNRVTNTTGQDVATYPSDYAELERMLQQHLRPPLDAYGSAS
jgi:hypothetical protein